MLLNTEKETRVKFNPGLSANRPSNNWAQEYIFFMRLEGFTILLKQRIFLCNTYKLTLSFNK